LLTLLLYAPELRALSGAATGASPAGAEVSDSPLLVLTLAGGCNSQRPAVKHPHPGQVTPSACAVLALATTLVAPGRPEPRPVAPLVHRPLLC
jgi:hypothetical protein